ncbi:MAG: diguanylate cyclase domain-containing protein, partial [Wenzhouxiangellaceae bacterium]
MNEGLIERRNLVRCLREGLAVLLFLLAGSAAALGLDDRIDEIERVHFSRPWSESQQMIDRLRDDLTGATVDQRARLALFEARNRMLGGNLELGRMLLQEALGAPMSIPLRLRALELLVAGYTLERDYEQAFSHLGQALELLEREDVAQVHASLMEIAARLHSDVGEYSAALEYAAESLAAAQRSDDPRALCIGRVGLAVVQRRAGLLEFALRDTDEILQQCQRGEDPLLIATAMLVIGWLANADGNHREAIGWLRRSIDLHDHGAVSSLGITDARLELGLALLRSGEIEAALEHLTEGAEDMGTTWLWSAREVHLLLAEAHEQLGQHEQGLRHLELARQSTLREVDENRLRRLAYLQVSFEQQRRELELDLARQHNRLLEVREENIRVQRRTRILVMVTTSLVLLLMLGLILRFRSDRKRFARISRVDGLTGLLNHRFFHQSASQSLSRSGQRGRACSLVAADVDLFKQINDRHGHRAGDAVLAGLGKLLQECFPPPAVVGRVGGEEFAIFLPDHNR